MTLRNFQVRELDGLYSIIWHDNEKHCVREGYNRFKTHAAAVKDMNTLEEASYKPTHWPEMKCEKCKGKGTIEQFSIGARREIECDACQDYRKATT